jgi:predicted transcriptional regulator
MRNKSGGKKKMININKLKAVLVEQGHNIEYLAESIEIPVSTLYRKLQNDGTKLTIKDAQKIANCLNLSKDDINAIFFAQQVA